MLTVPHVLQVLDSFSSSNVFEKLIEVVSSYIPADMIVLLKKEGSLLIPVEFIGASNDLKDICFSVEEHPRLKIILENQGITRFPSGSDLPDPYDQLIDQEDLYVHDCMGMPIRYQGEIWGVMTFDTLEENKFSLLTNTLKEEIYDFVNRVISSSHHLNLYVSRVNKEKFIIKNKIYLDSANQLVGESLGYRNGSSEYF